MDIVLIAMLGAIVFVGLVMFSVGDQAVHRRYVRRRQDSRPRR